MRILLIEDEAALSAGVKRGLEEEHYEVDAALDGLEGLEMARSRRYSAIILDVMLPGKDGWTICQELRESRDSTPILMLTARDAVDDRVRGLEMGADDYLPKPFDFTEMLARIRALVRRDKVHKERVINIADLRLDTGARTVTRGGRPITLTEREYTLLEALATYEGRVLSREAIQERVWLDEDSYSNTVDVHIGLLRKKIDQDQPVKLIHTVRGMGYTLRRESGDS